MAAMGFDGAMADEEFAADFPVGFVLGNEAEVTRRVRELADAGVDDFHASIFVATDDAGASVSRTRELLKSLVGAV